MFSEMVQESIFVDREKAITLFKEWINVDHPTGKPFWQLYGEPGIGKTALIKHLKRLCPEHIATAEIPLELERPDALHTTIIDAIVTALGSKIPNSTPFTTVTEDIQEKSRDQLKREFIKVVQKEINPYPVLIILDALEYVIPESQSKRETSESAKWLIHFLHDFTDVWPTVRVLFSRRSPLPFETIKAKCKEFELKPLVDSDVTEYFNRLQIQDTNLTFKICQFIQGHPLSMSIAGGLCTQSEKPLQAEDLDTEEFRQAYHDKMVPELLTNRILDIDDEHLKKLIKQAGLLRRFNREILQQNLNFSEDDITPFTRHTHSFTSSSGGYSQYHSQVRQTIIKDYLQQEPADFSQDCARFYDYFLRQGSDERFYYGILGNVKTVFEEWVNTWTTICDEYNNIEKDEESPEGEKQVLRETSLERLRTLITMIDEIREIFPEFFSARKQAEIWLIKGNSSERLAPRIQNEKEQLALWEQALSNYHRSEECFKNVGKQTALRAVKNNIGAMLFNIGLLYAQRGDENRAREYYQSSKTIFCEIEAQENLGRLYNAIGAIDWKQSDNNEALKWYHQSEDILSKIGDLAGLAVTYNDLFLIYGNLEDQDSTKEAEDYEKKMRKSLAILQEESVQSSWGLPITYPINAIAKRPSEQSSERRTATMQPSEKPVNDALQARRRQELEVEYDLLSEKIKRLKKAHVIETGAAENFKLEKQIEEAEEERKQIEEALEKFVSPPCNPPAEQIEELHTEHAQVGEDRASPKQQPENKTETTGQVPREKKISEIQNEPLQLERLAAQRQMYDDVRKRKDKRIWVVLASAVCWAILSPFVFTHKLTTPVVGGCIAFFDLVVFLYWEHSLQEHAAKTQELFDCDVLQIERNRYAIDNLPSAAEIAKFAAEYDPQNYPKSPLENWYSPTVDRLPLYLGRIVCQLSNVNYDANLRGRYAMNILWRLVLVGIVSFSVCVIPVLKTSLGILIAVMAPVFEIGIAEIVTNWVAIRSLHNLKKNMDRLEPETLTEKADETELTHISRYVQNDIYKHRKNSPVIPKKIYDRYRDPEEEAMYRDTNALVEEALRHLQQ